MTSVALVAEVDAVEFAAPLELVADYLRGCGFSVVELVADADIALVYADRTPTATLLTALADRPVLLAGPTVDAWRDARALLDTAGVVPGRLTPRHEIRLRPGPDRDEVTARFGEEWCLTDRLLLLDKTADDTLIHLRATWQLTEHAVAASRGSVGLLTLGTEPAVLGEPAYQRLVHRMLRHLLGLRDGPDVRVGLLGFGAIGPEHAAAIAHTRGLGLASVCDRKADRVAVANRYEPALRVATDADALIADEAVDLIVVSTPPDSHVTWALAALEAGKHVVVEKPFCLTVSEADSMLDAAAANDRLLTVYQNRRWDADYLALRGAVRSGVLGTVFDVESFVGGYGHPCSYWHSDEDVSGGAIYDWGSHYLDWILDLMPQPVDWVAASAQKRVWHDVTNADHTRVTLRFADGAEAEFIHSDIAAAPKPKWYVLGERGAIRGDWRFESVVSRTSIGTLAEDRLAAADSPAALTVCLPDGSGAVHEQRLSVPPAPAYVFHRELADQLLSGEPMSVTAVGSRRTVAVMEAATVSAREGGRPVTPSA